MINKKKKKKTHKRKNRLIREIKRDYSLINALHKSLCDKIRNLHNDSITVVRREQKIKLCICNLELEEKKIQLNRKTNNNKLIMRFIS